ncbi:hypothetical protein BLS_005713 [Venturia inaequalis]|uniref:BOD1/SHG1 domain-containing protein n=1 Tax=Venturia inaequalis TaxID=5025 RepID=A0A8H3VDV0_VENIN|nr:hypothetical protein BLS_005713 [Venturia inaequalis]
MPSLVWKANGRGRANKKDPEDAEFTRRKLTAADLPITGEQRQTIDALLNTFRKSGEFDKLRKAIFTQFETSSAKTSMKDAIERLAESEVDRQPNLLSKERRQAVALIEGAVERSEIYRNAQTNVDQLVQQLLSQAEDTLRDFRRREVGIEAALEELKHGSKSDEEYEREFNKRRQERLAEAEEENERYKREEEEERLRKEEEKKRRKEEEEALEKEREKERAEREERRKRERDEREKEREAEIEREREERRERRKREEERYHQESHDRERRTKERDRSRERRRARDDSRERSRRYSPEPRREEEVPFTEQSLEEIALQELLAEGQKLAKKSSKPPTRARSPSIEPPPRKILPPKSLVPRDPVAARLAKLESSTTKSEPDTHTALEVSRKKTPAKIDVPAATTTITETEMTAEPPEDTTMMIEDIDPPDTMTIEILDGAQEVKNRIGSHIGRTIYTAPAGEILLVGGQSHQSQNARREVAPGHESDANPDVNELQWLRLIDTHVRLVRAEKPDNDIHEKKSIDMYLAPPADLI